MVGALSIVRFRTAVKEPVDTGFMFWGRSAGIMAGAGLYIPAVVASLGIGVLYFVTFLMGFKVANRYLLVLKYKSSAHDDVLKKLKSLENKAKIETGLVDQFSGMDGVINASLIAYQNDFGE